MIGPQFGNQTILKRQGSVMSVSLILQGFVLCILFLHGSENPWFDILRHAAEAASE